MSNLPPGVKFNDPHFRGEEMKPCPTCDEAGETVKDFDDLTRWERVKLWFGIETFILCPVCGGEMEIALTEEDHDNQISYWADRHEDEEKDRRLGL